MNNFKMRDVEYRRIALWNPDCMTKRFEWVAFLNGKAIAYGNTKTEIIESVRKKRMNKHENI